MPLKKSQLWFLKNFNRFKKNKAKTDDKGKYKHTTLGRIVPIDIMIKEVEGITLIKQISKKINA